MKDQSHQILQGNIYLKVLFSKLLFITFKVVIKDNINYSIRSILKNSDIDLYNSQSEHVLADLSDENPNKLVIWSSLSRIADMVLDQMADGVKLPSRVVQQGVLVMHFQNCFLII